MKYITFLWSRSRIAPWNTTANVVISKSCMLVCAIVPVPFPRPSILVRAYTGADAQGGRSAGTRARAARRGRQAARTSDRSARLRGKGAFPIHPSHALQSSESCAVLVMRRRNPSLARPVMRVLRCPSAVCYPNHTAASRLGLNTPAPLRM